VLPFFALVLPVLLGFMALGVDAANFYLERREAQSAADLAALAGVKSLPSNAKQARNDACAVAELNDYTTSSTYPCPPVIVTTPYASADTRIEVVVDETVDTFFMPILSFFASGDFSSRTISARAVALSEPGEAGDYAIYTLQPCGTSEAYKALDWSGSNTDVTGSIHSSAGILIGGSDNTVSGSITYECVNQFSEPGSNPQIPPKKNPDENCPDGPTGNIPCRYDDTPPALPGYSDFYNGIAPYKACNFQRSGDFDVASNDGPWFKDGKKSTKQLLAGKYCATGTLKIGSEIEVIDFIDVVNSGSRTGITLVANKIEISGSNFKLYPAYDSGILAFANATTADALKFSGSTGTFEGLLYAPRGTVEISGSDNSTLTGAIVARNVKMNGSKLDIIGTYGATAPGYQQLIE
jgi:hypothetical protein